MRVHEIMTRQVHTARPDTTVGEIARLMTRERISGVPIVDGEGRLIGIVSETDLLHRAETGTERKRKWWVALFLDGDQQAREYIKGHGQTAGDIMSKFVVSVDENASLAEVANTLDKNNLKRAPVLGAGKLVGMVTRGDLVKAVAAQSGGAAPQAGDNADVQKRIMDEINRQAWVDAAHVSSVVTDDTVEVWGYVASIDRRKALGVLVREMAGGRAVEDHLAIGSPTGVA